MEAHGLKKTENSAIKCDESKTSGIEASECAFGRGELDTRKASQHKRHLLKTPSLKNRCWQRAFTATGTSLCFIAAFGSALDVWMGIPIQPSGVNAICIHQNDIEYRSYQMHQILTTYHKITKLGAYATHESVKVISVPQGQSSSDLSDANSSDTGAWANFWQSCTTQKVLSIIIFTVATTGVYQLRRTDSRQDRYLLGGITTGVAIGLFKEKDLQAAILNVMPWAILISLICSILGHGLWHREVGTRLPLYTSSYDLYYEIATEKDYH